MTKFPEDSSPGLKLIIICVFSFSYGIVSLNFRFDQFRYFLDSGLIGHYFKLIVSATYCLTFLPFFWYLIKEISMSIEKRVWMPLLKFVPFVVFTALFPAVIIPFSIFLFIFGISLL